MIITAIQGETDRENAQRILDNYSSTTIRADGSILPKEFWPVAQCYVLVVFDDGFGSRAEIVVQDWGSVAGLQIGMVAPFTIG